MYAGPRCQSCYRKSHKGHKKWCPTLTSTPITDASYKLPSGAPSPPTIPTGTAAPYRCTACSRKTHKGHKKWCSTRPENDSARAAAAGFTQIGGCGNVARCGTCSKKSYKGHKKWCPVRNAPASTDVGVAGPSTQPGSSYQDGVAEGIRYARGQSQGQTRDLLTGDVDGHEGKMEAAMGGVRRERDVESEEGAPPAYESKDDAPKAWGQ